MLLLLGRENNCWTASYTDKRTMYKEKITLSEIEWKKRLTSEEFKILRKKETEQPFTGRYVHNTKKGVYLCAGCGNELFSSDAKFDSGSGWLSFTASINPGHLEQKPDTSIGMKRTEIVCSRCGGHLGHVFDDGPKPTGCRFCINSAALHFKEIQTK